MRYQIFPYSTYESGNGYQRVVVSTCQIYLNMFILGEGGRFSVGMQCEIFSI